MTPRYPVAERQLILLAVVHPLWVRLEERPVPGGPQRRKARRPSTSAVAVLEEVRDMDRSSVCGRRAHQLREELRKSPSGGCAV